MTSRAILAWQVALGLLLLGGWELVGRNGGGKFVSRPSLVAGRLAAWFSGSIYVHLGTTLIELVLGLAIGVVARHRRRASHSGARRSAPRCCGR